MHKISLNGSWQFKIDPQYRGEAEKWQEQTPTQLMNVNVPHVWQNENDELALYTGDCWYFKHFNTPQKPNPADRSSLIFEAVDYSCMVWLNGALVCRHDGGFLPFDIDVTEHLLEGENRLVLKVTDPLDNSEIPIGKQGTWYTRVSGIWQSVWLEYHRPVKIKTIRLIPDIENMTLQAELEFTRPLTRTTLQYTVVPHLEGEEKIAEGEAELSGKISKFTISVNGAELWSPDSPILYELHGRLSEAADDFTEIFGMRHVEQRDGRIYLNGTPLYIRGALEQGFYPETVYIPPSDDFIINEINMAKAMGFNLLRKHIKAELPRYLYWCDRMGMLLWCEAPNYVKWGAKSRRVYEDCLHHMIIRDFNHPSIIIWSIFNEEWGLEWSLTTNEDMRSYLSDFYDRLKVFDPTRIYCDNSGWTHVKTDINDYHPYAALPDQADFWQEYLTTLAPGDNFVGGRKSRGEVILLSEFGMWGLVDPAKDYKDLPLWYDNRDAKLKDPSHNLDFKIPATGPKNFEKYNLSNIFGSYDHLLEVSQKRMMRGIKAIIENMRVVENIGGYVITEFSDIEWEGNGMLDYYRRPKWGFESIIDFNGPTAVFFAPFEHNQISGDRLSLDVVIANDNLYAIKGILKWSLCRKDVALLEGSEAVSVDKPLTNITGAVNIVIPAVNEPDFYTIKLEISNDGAVIAKNTDEITISPGVSGRYGDIAIFPHRIPAVFEDRLKNKYRVEPDGIAICAELDEHMLEFCYKGGQVLFLAEKGTEIEWNGDFTFRQLNTGIEWNRASSFNFIDPKIFDGIPLNIELGWEVQHMYPDFIVPFDDYTKKAGRIVNMTGNKAVADNSHLMAGFFQAWVGQFGATMLKYPYGKGQILLTTFKFMDYYGKHPIADRMLDRLIEKLYSTP